MFESRGGQHYCALGCGYRGKKESWRAVVDMQGMSGWESEFVRTVEGCAESCLPFTSEHVRAMVGGGSESLAVKLVALVSQRGLIRKTGVQVLYRGTEVDEWIGTKGGSE